MLVSLNFPKPILSSAIPAGGVKPTYRSLDTIQTELNDNAMSQKTRFAGGHFGFLGLTIPEKTLLTLTNGEKYEAPVAPPAAPPHAPGATQPQITETNRQHLQDLKDYETYTSVATALKTSLIAAVPDIFLSDLKNNITGYATKTVLDMMTHLWAHYGVITPEELVMNEQSMSTAWKFPNAIEHLFDQLRVGMEFADKGGDPVSEKSAMLKGYFAIEANAEFKDACKEWRRNVPEADKNMAAFKELFGNADTDLRRMVLRPTQGGATTGQAGYHSANQVYEAVPFNNDMVTAPANYAEAVNFAAPAQAPGGHPATTGPTYCFTHGIMPKGGHTSATCKQRGEEGHKVGATMSNKMGGNKNTFVPYYKRAPTEE